MTNGGFQNYLHLMYGLPNGWIVQYSPGIDTHDAIVEEEKKRQFKGPMRGPRKRKKQEDLIKKGLVKNLLGEVQASEVLNDSEEEEEILMLLLGDL